jgi:hypothetical protein
MPHIFTKKWEENHTLCRAHKLEHPLILLKTIVKTFLLNEWALVACGISIATPSIIGTEFFG